MTVNGDQPTVIKKKSDVSRHRDFDFKLYLITDRQLFKSLCSFYLAIEDALSGGVKTIQLREKDLTTKELFEIASWMRELTKEYDARLFINDRVDVALAVGADGVHLGQKSIPLHAVRNSFGNKLIIGCSTHSLEEALKAEKEGADFITLGPIYETPSKIIYGKPIGLEVLREVKSRLLIPVFAIGGIKLNNVRDVIEAGADGIALISAIFTEKNIKDAAKEFMRLLK